MAGSPLRVVVWATGSVGQNIIRRCAVDPRLELVGTFVYGEDKDGQDAGAIAGIDPIGVTATRDKAAILALDADIVIHAPKGHHVDEAHDSDVEALLRSGKNVISTRGYFNPYAFGETYAQRWLDACAAGGVTLAGLGMSPGFVGERLAVTLSGGCLDLQTLTLREAYDCTKLLPTMLEKMGFGSSREDYEASAINVNYDDLYLPTLHNVVTALGGTVERWEASHEIVTAQGEVTAATWPVPAGSVQGTLRRWTGYSGGRALFVQEYLWFVGQVPGWPDRSCWQVETEGAPRYKLTLDFNPREGEHPDLHGHAMMTATLVNAIPHIVAHEPGVFRTPVFAPYQDQ